MAFAGLGESWRGPDGNIERTFAITTDANADVATLHDRMPVIVEPSDWPIWLGEVEGDPATLLRPSPCGTVRVRPVSRHVNDPRNNEPVLLDAVEAPPG